MSGGQSNLTGLLYELLVAQTLLLALDEPHLEVANGFDGFDVWLMASETRPDILLQYCDTDALVEGEEGLVIIQCKASAAPESKAIALAEFKQILVEGAKQLRRIRDLGDFRRVRAFVLVSNRPLSEDLTNLGPDCMKIRSYGNRADCPGALLNGAPPCSLNTWCTGLVDMKVAKPVGPEGKQLDRPKIDAATAESASELLLGFHYAILKDQDCQSHFRRSMQRLGLFTNEIDDVAHQLKGRLLDAARDGLSISDALKSMFFRPSTYHNLCPENLINIENVELDRAWVNAGISDEGQTFLNSGLPRMRLVERVTTALVEATQREQCRAVVLVGDGGVGKTQLAFQIPKFLRAASEQASIYQVFGVSDGGPNVSPKLAALRPFFDGYSYAAGTGTVLSDRLQRAWEACSAQVTLWIMIPNADELNADDLQNLLSQLLSGSADGARYILTARQKPWLNKGRHGSEQSVKVVMIEDLAEDELYEWFASYGVRQETMTRIGLATGDPMTSVSGRSAGDAIRAGWLNHPLSFSALRTWVGTADVGTGKGRLQRFLNEDGGVLLEFATFARSVYCGRIHKHCSRYDIDITHVQEVFDNLWAMSARLSDVRPRDWAETLCLGLLFGDKPEKLIEQFVQVGVLSYRDSNRTLQWRVPYPAAIPGVPK